MSLHNLMNGANFGIRDTTFSGLVNTGTGLTLASRIAAKNLFIKTLIPGSNVVLTDNGQSITINSTGGSIITGTVTTTNNTPTDLITIPTQAQTAIAVDVLVVGAKLSTDTTNVFFLKASFKNISGTTSEIVDDDILSFKEDPLTSSNVVASGANIVVRVTGLFLTTMKWSGEVRVHTLDYS